MLRFTLSMLTLACLAGCVIVQDGYDQQALQECRDLPRSVDQLECERRALDAEYARRQEKLREN